MNDYFIESNKVDTIFHSIMSSKWKYALFIVPFLFISVCILLKCRYGFVSADEAFYFETTYRIIQGDAFIWDEWSLAQLYVFPIIPILSAIILFTKSAEGIFFIMRILYTIIQIAASLFIFSRLKKISFCGSIFASLCFMVYAPYSIMALSYNTIAPISLAVCCVILMTARRYRKFQYFISGCLFSFSVLSCPYLIVFFIFWVFLSVLLRKKNISVLDTTKVLFLSLGAFSIAVLFIIFLFSRISLSQFSLALPHILTDDTHSIVSFQKIYQYFKEIIHPHFYINIDNTFPFHTIFIILCFISFIVILIDKHRKKHNYIYFSVLLLFSLSNMILIYIKWKYINTAVFPLNVLPPILLFLSDNKKIRKVFCYLWIPGIVYSFLLFLGSDNGFLSISSGCIISLIGSILILFIFNKECLVNPINRNVNTISRFILIFVLTFQLYSLTYLRITNVFMEVDFPSEEYSESEVITEGTQKWIKPSLLYKSKYDAIRKDIYEIENNVGINKVMFYSCSPWLYLEMPTKRVACFTSYFWFSDKYSSRQLSAYYDLDYSRKPDLVYYPFTDFYGDKVNENEFNNYFHHLFINYKRYEMSNGVALIK